MATGNKNSASNNNNKKKNTLQKIASRTARQSRVGEQLKSDRCGCIAVIELALLLRRRDASAETVSSTVARTCLPSTTTDIRVVSSECRDIQGREKTAFAEILQRRITKTASCVITYPLALLEGRANAPIASRYVRNDVRSAFSAVVLETLSRRLLLLLQW